MKNILYWLALSTAQLAWAQPTDTLRSTSCDYDVHFYDVAVQLLPQTQTLEGRTTIHFSFCPENQSDMVLDLPEVFKVSEVVFEGKKMEFARKGSRVVVYFPKILSQNKRRQLTVTYRGKPVLAKSLPREGGFLWQKDAQNQDWIMALTERPAQSGWFACHDVWRDKADSLRVQITVPAGLTAVSSGQLRQRKAVGKNQTLFVWQLNRPILPEQVALVAGVFDSISESYPSQDTARTTLVYYVLQPNKRQAEGHFTQLRGLLANYEKLLGPLDQPQLTVVEAPFWGFAQAGVLGYGQRFKNNALGFDPVLAHTLAEQFAGLALSANDRADVWLHKGLVTYLVASLVEQIQGKEKALEILISQRQMIKNVQPILGEYQTEYMPKDADHFFKGAWLWHTLRHSLNDDTQWQALLRAMYQDRCWKGFSTEKLIQFLEQRTQKKWRVLIDNYLQTTNIPTLQYEIVGNQKKRVEVKYRWVGVEDTFEMPVRAGFGLQDYQVLWPSKSWQTRVFRRPDHEPEFRFATELALINLQEQ
jgi:aminopeptidase N